MTRWIVTLLTIALMLAVVAFPASISRLRDAEISNNNVINADDLDTEFNQLVNSHNDQETRILTLETGNTTISGNKTFSGDTTLDGATYKKAKKFMEDLKVTYTDSNQVTIATGRAMNDAATEVIEVTSSTNVSLGCSGAVNCLDTGSEASSTWYYLWLIKNPSSGTVGGLFSTSTTSPTMPTGYTMKRRMPLAVRNNGSSNIEPFYIARGWPNSAEVYYRTPYSIATGLTATSFTTQSVAAGVPATSTFGLFQLQNTNGSFAGGFTSRPTGLGSDSGFISLSGGFYGYYEAETDSSQSIDYKVSQSTWAINARGYVITDFD